MNNNLNKLYYNREDIYMIPKIEWGKLNENKINPELIKDFPVNKPVKFNKSLMIKAIQNGMIILINYRGDKDKWRGGRERVICPLVLGRNKNTGNMLVRGWHLDGWSVSEKRNTKKVWRLFKTVNIMSMMFTGDFFRMPPSGYKRNDRVMTEVTYVAADFNVVRRNQMTLVQKGLIEDEEERSIEKPGIVSIEVKNTDTILSLDDIWANEYFNKKNQQQLELTFVKSIVGANYIAILGVRGEKGNSVKLYEGKKLLGAYKSVLSVPDKKSSLTFMNQMRKHKTVDNQKEFPLYTFVKKL
jgi:hypothetical protein